MLYLRSLVFYVFYVFSGIVAGLVGCIVGPFVKMEKRIKLLSSWPKLSNWLLHKICKVEVLIEGRENIPDAPFVIASNHQGQWETFFYQYSFFPLSTLLKRELLLIPIWGWALSLLKPIAINRGSPTRALKKALTEGEKRIKEGFTILIFPEGTRKKPGEIGKYARSGFELAKKMDVPVLPVVHNSGDCWPAHRFLKFPGTIRVIIGSPLNIIKSSSESASEVESWARKNLSDIKR